jgi:hypothetical protein
MIFVAVDALKSVGVVKTLRGDVGMGDVVGDPL